MKLTFRTSLFDCTSPIQEHEFYGRDLAEWLKCTLADWECSVDSEDWGWSMYCHRDKYEYIIGVYDHDTLDINDHGPRWCIRLYNQKDYRNFLRRLIKPIPPTAQPEVVDEILAVLNDDDRICDIIVEPLE